MPLTRLVCVGRDGVARTFSLEYEQVEFEITETWHFRVFRSNPPVPNEDFFDLVLERFDAWARSTPSSMVRWPVPCSAGSMTPSSSRRRRVGPDLRLPLAAVGGALGFRPRSQLCYSGTHASRGAYPAQRSASRVDQLQ